MVEQRPSVRTKKARDEQFDERYMGLSKADVALREKMAQRFGRKTTHLDATQKPLLLAEEFKDPIASKTQEQPVSGLQAQRKMDPASKLRQLQMDNDRYRASIESGHQLLQAQIGEPRQSSQAAQQMPSYKFKYMQPSVTDSELLQQNSNVSEPEQQMNEQSPAASNSQQNESSRKNLQLLKTILMDYSAEELENEIFTLNEVITTSKNAPSANSTSTGKKSSSKLSHQDSGASRSGRTNQPPGQLQIILNEKQFNLIKKVYPQAFQTQTQGRSTHQSFAMGQSNHTPQFSLQDSQLIIQFFANMKALHRRMADQPH